MIIKFIKGFLLFCLIMLIIQTIILIVSFAMAMDGANHYNGQSNVLYVFLKYILGFPLYILFDLDTLTNSKIFRFELVLLFVSNSLIQFSFIHFIKFKIKQKSN